MVAISPTTHQVVASQPVGMQAAECDVDVAFNNLWCVGSLSGESNYITAFNMQRSLANGFGNGTPTVYSGWLPTSGAPFSISVDAPDRVAFIASGGGLYKWSIRQPGILGTITPPDGYAVQNVLYSPFFCESDTALVLTTLGTNSSGYVVADWWFANLNAHSTCSTAWVPISYQTFTGENNLFQPFPVLKAQYQPKYTEFIFSDSTVAPLGTGASWLLLPNFGGVGEAWVQYNVDANDNAANQAPWYVSGQALDKAHAIYVAVVPTYLGTRPGTTQVLFSSTVPGYWPYPKNIVPGITVANAVFATVDGTHRIAYTSGTDGLITAISY
jgi:hypothetical protein